MILQWAAKQAAFLEVTPAIAAYWLAHHNANNRTQRASVVRQYRRDIESSQWRETGETISFDRNGQLVNGQHRLSAIVLAQKSIQVLVVTGLDPDVRSYVDTQAKRTVVDAFNSSSDVDDLWGKLSSSSRTTAVAMWTSMIAGIAQSRLPTRSEVLDFARVHREAGAFACRLFLGGRSVRGVTVGPVLAAFARAFYHYPDRRDELTQLGSALVTGVQSSRRDLIAVHLRRVLESERNHTSGDRAACYGKTTRAIKCYMDGEDRQLFRVPTVELFPLPDGIALEVPA